VSFTYDVTTPRGQVRLLLNDVDAATAVFKDAEIDAFLALEGASVKLAAAQAIDTNATNEALASKVIKDHQQQTDGAKVADAMRKHAAALRDQVAGYDDAGVFEVVDFTSCWPEGTEPPLTGCW
jgi:hypothetical protein